MELRGINAVITGAASGIGLGLARVLATEGTRLMIADIERDKAERAADSLRMNGADAIAVEVDVAERDSIEALADAAFDHFGAVHLLVNNAGVGTQGPLEKVSLSNWDWVFAVNVGAIHHAAHAFVPRLKEQKAPARIVNTASEHGLGLPPRGLITAYTASKHAVVGLSDAMRRDYQGTNISVAVICPAVVQTEIWNPFRNRQPRFGGPRPLDPQYAPEEMKGLSPDIAGYRIVEGLKADEFYIFTHGRDIEAVHAARRDELDAAFARFAERFGPDA